MCRGVLFHVTASQPLSSLLIMSDHGRIAMITFLEMGFAKGLGMDFAGGTAFGMGVAKGASAWASQWAWPSDRES